MCHVSLVSEAHVRKQDLVFSIACDTQSLPSVFCFEMTRGLNRNLDFGNLFESQGGKCQWWETQKRPPAVFKSDFFKSKIGELGRPIVIFVFPFPFHVQGDSDGDSKTHQRRPGKRIDTKDICFTSCGIMLGEVSVRGSSKWTSRPWFSY